MFANRHDGSYFAYAGDEYLGVVRKIGRGRWVAVPATLPPDAAEFRTRREAAAWLRQQVRKWP